MDGIKEEMHAERMAHRTFERTNFRRFIPSVGDTDAVVDLGKGHLEEVVGDDRRGVSEAEQRVVGKHCLWRDQERSAARVQTGAAATGGTHGWLRHEIHGCVHSAILALLV